ncbi:tetratricopeptide repeat protein [Acerihabitans arboris]|uniref:Tetratricopeptide repeat protein n=1 Tax=Acerihabitans arboris TaxID=2691583 RepID=A0A845SRJ6_9GAMM|nr:tetratricopeptide repeat protein [Acerihabitans arboris]NDL65496.1 tetratricopeptide repeat protein [Acerihabitans arboris]
MDRILKAGAIALGLHGALSYATPKDEQIKTDCARIDDYAQAGNTAYQQGHMDRAVDEFTAQAAWSEFCRLPPGAINTAYNNVALALIHSGEPLKAAAWLSLAPADDKTRVNLALIQPVLDRLRPALAATPMGNYWRYAGKGVWSTIAVQPEGNVWKISFNGFYMPVMGMYYGPNMGEFSVVQSLEGGHGVYRQDEQADGSSCQVNMTFKADVATLETLSGDCGFGVNVRANGDFKRVSLY